MNSKYRQLTISAMVIAIYVVIMYLTQSFAFGQYQIRIATSVYALAAIHPFLILPLGFANLLSNTLMGGLGIMDMAGGFAAGILTSMGCYYARKISAYLVFLPIFLVPSLLVPIWLSIILGVPYLVLAISIGAGQIIPGMMGVLLVKYMEKPFARLAGENQ